MSNIIVKNLNSLETGSKQLVDLAPDKSISIHGGAEQTGSSDLMKWFEELNENARLDAIYRELMSGKSSR